jgi:predicted dehydrogenase
VKLGIIGHGNRSRSLIRAATESGRFRIAAISDGREDGSGSPRSSAGDASYYESWQDMLKSDLDAVVVAVPNHRHAEIVATALESGLHVFCEKPIATTLEDTVRMLQLAERSGRVLQVGMELRYSPAVQDLLTRIETAPDLLWAQEFRPPFRPGVLDWRLDPRRSGGTLLEKNCHHFDLFCLLAGDRPVAVSAWGSGPTPGMLDHATVNVRFGRGTVASLALSMTQVEERLRFGALGSGWSYEYDSDGEVSRILDAHGATEHHWPVDTSGLETGGWDHPGEVEQFQAFARRIDGAPDPTSERMSPLWSHLIAFAADRAIRHDGIVRITEEGALR